MKQKRNNNNIVGNGAVNVGVNSNTQNRDGSNEPYDNQRVDTGGGEYTHNEEDSN